MKWLLLLLFLSQMALANVNDSRLSPLDLGSATSVDFDPDNTDATHDPDDWPGTITNHAGTLWYEWQAPEDGLLFIHAASETFLYDAVVRVHLGDGGATDNPVAFFAARNLSSERIPVTAGQRYLLSYSTSNYQRPGPAKVSLRFTDTDPTYQYTAATELPSETPIHQSGSFRSALADDTPDYSLLLDGSLNPPKATLWHSWQAPASGLYLARRTSGNVTLAIWRDTSPPEFLAGNLSGYVKFEAEAGERYFISPLFYGSANLLPNSHFQWTLESGAVPQNDDFANRVSLPNTSEWETQNDNLWAGSESDEPSHHGEEASQSLWYSWTSPQTGTFLLDVAQFDFTKHLAIYTGNELADLTPVASGSSRVIFEAQAGITYQIAIDGRGLYPFTSVLKLEPATRPVHDDFKDRLVISGPRPTFNENLRFATIEPDEPNQSSSYETTSSVWYEWTPTWSTRLRGSPQNIGVFQSAEEDPELADLDPVSYTTSGGYSVRSSRTYYIQIRHSGRTPTFPIILNTADEPPRPAPRTLNTDFDERRILPSLASLRTGADPEGLEQQHIADSSLGGAVTGWWSWTAPESGPFQLNGSSSSGAEVAVFTGENFPDLTEIARGGSSGLIFEAEAGLTYHFTSHANSRASTRWATLELKQLNSPPSNDGFNTPLDLKSPISIRRTLHNYFATAEPNEPGFEGNPAERSVWLQWTAPFSGPFTLSASEDSKLSLFTGDEINNLTEIVSGLETITSNVQQGNTYRIRWDSPTPQYTLISGDFDYPPFTNNDFSQATELSGSFHAVLGNADLCDLESNEPRPPSASSSGGSAWWKWIPDQTGATNIELAGDGMTFAIYRGTSLTDLSEVISVSSSSYDIRFHAVAGETYWLQLIATWAWPPGRREVSFILDQDLQAAENDLFENATPLSGSDLLIEVPEVPASFQEGEPGSRIQSRWYAWTAPEEGQYLLDSSRGITIAHRGNSLNSLVEIPTFGETIIQANAGESFMISFGDQLAREALVTISQIHGPHNDHFADRIDLGTSDDIEFDADLSYSTFEDGEPESTLTSVYDGSAWWQWTAPRDGLISLSERIYAFTGSFLDSLSPLSDNPIEQFQAQAGQTYQFAVASRSSTSAYTFGLSMSTAPNDQLENRQIIPPQLPFHWEGRLPNLTRQRLERGINGSAWWEWTAPATGTVRYQGTHRMGIAAGSNDPIELPSLDGTSSGYIDVVEGETYFIRSEGDPFETTSFFLGWEMPQSGEGSKPNQPIVISGPNPSATITVPPGPFNSSVWYQWTSSVTGTVTFNWEDTDVLGPGFYRLSSPDDIERVDPFDEYRPNYFPIETGETYLIVIRFGSDPNASWQLSMGPNNDNFSNATVLPSITSIIQAGTTEGAGRQAEEPSISNQRPERSVWYSWQAPTAGTYCFAVDDHYAGVLTGNQIDGLTVVAEGRSGEFEAIEGQTYHFLVNSGTGGRPFELTINPANPLYDTWKASYFGDTDTHSSKPSSDPDGDGLTNLIEMALGRNPLIPDGPLPLSIQSTDDSLVLSIKRPTDLSGVNLTFEVSDNLNDWYDPLDQDHEVQVEPAEEGLEIYRIDIPKNQEPAPSFRFVRLRATLP